MSDVWDKKRDLTYLSIILHTCSVNLVILWFQASATDWKTAENIYHFSANDIDGNEVSLDKYK